MNKFRKIASNLLLLIFILGVVMLPAVSTGIMKVNKDDRVLSMTSKREEKAPIKNTSNRKIETIIIKEIRQTTETSETTETKNF